MTYFGVAGRENVDKTLELVKRLAEEHGIKKVIVASITGFTARKALEVLKDMGVTLTVVGTERNTSTAIQRGHAKIIYNRHRLVING